MTSDGITNIRLKVILACRYAFFEPNVCQLRALDVADEQAHPGIALFFLQGFDPGAVGAHKGLALDLLAVFRESNR